MTTRKFVFKTAGKLLSIACLITLEILLIISFFN